MPFLSLLSKIQQGGVDALREIELAVIWFVFSINSFIISSNKFNPTRYKVSINLISA